LHTPHYDAQADDRQLAQIALDGHAALMAEIDRRAAAEKAEIEARRQRERVEHEREKARAAEVAAAREREAEAQRAIAARRTARVDDVTSIIDACSKITDVQARYAERYTAADYMHTRIADVLMALLLSGNDVDAATTVLRQRVQAAEAIRKIDPHKTVTDADVWSMMAIALGREPRS
jgi:hypothetical protein